MNVAIIGAGISGLTAYLSLRRYLADSTISLSVKIYESHDSPTPGISHIGGGIALAPNGQRSVAAMSPGAVEYIQEHGSPGSIMTFRNSRGRLLGRLSFGRKERYGFETLMMHRDVVHKSLVLQDMPQDVIEWGRKVRSVRETDEGVVVEFADGSTENADFVIGADGAQSVVRQAIFGGLYPAQYDGFTDVGGVIPLSSLPQYLQDSFKTDGVTMAWGSDGFFWYSLCTPVDDQGEASVQWWSTHESPTPVRRDQTPSVIQEQLLARHGHWNSPYDTPESTIHEIIIKLGCSSAGGKDNLLILPRYTIPRIPHWSTPSGSGRIILLGDAAHTMSPESAQGISSAAEDALAIGLLLRHYCATRSLDLPEALRQVAKAYEKIRMKKVRFILKIARMSRYSMKKRTWCGERIRDLILRIFCKLPESLSDGIFGNDVEAAVANYVRKTAT